MRIFCRINPVLPSCKKLWSILRRILQEYRILRWILQDFDAGFFAGLILSCRPAKIWNPQILSAILQNPFCRALGEMP
jgi:hypothetical protein